MYFLFINHHNITSYNINDNDGGGGVAAVTADGGDDDDDEVYVVAVELKFPTTMFVYSRFN